MSTFLSRISSNPKSDFFGGLTAAVTALPLAIAFGVLVSSEIGPEWSSVGAIAGLYGAIFTGFFASLFGGTPSQITGPTGPMTTVMAGLVAGLVAKFGAQLSPEEILLVTFLTVLASGAIQIGLGVMRLGGLVKYIPYPVVAGFMNGIAVIIFLSQRKIFVGAEDGQIDLATTFVGFCTVAIIMLFPRITKAVPGSLMGLGLGTVIYYAVKHGTPHLDLGPVVGAVPTAIPNLKNLTGLLSLPGNDWFSTIIPVVVTSAISLAVLGAIDSLLTSVVADTVTKTRHDSNQELIGQGLGNMMSGIFGGFAGAGATIRTLVNVDAGGRGKLSGMIHSLALLIVVVAVGSTAGKIPNVVLSGILMVTAWGMLDRWSLGLVKKLRDASENRGEIVANLGLVLIVTVVTVTVDLMVAVGVGLVLASFYFVGQTSNTIVRGIYTGDGYRSRRVYPYRAQKELEGRGRETLIVELQGPLFFGSADKFIRSVEDRLEAATRRVILDLHRVTGIDSSGGRTIAMLQENLAAKNRQLAIAGVGPESRHWSFLEEMGIVNAIKPEFFFPDLDLAGEWSEVTILTECDLSLDADYQEHALRELGLFESFSDEEFERFQPYLEHVECKKGDYLWRKSDPGDSIIIVTQGAVHLFVGEDATTGSRLAHFGPGSTLGEVSLLGNTVKGSSAVVDLDLKAFRLSRTSLEKLQAEEPVVAGRLLWSLGREMSQRIKNLREEIHTVED